jgi:hypothetical protein
MIEDIAQRSTFLALPVHQRLLALSGSHALA